MAHGNFRGRDLCYVHSHSRFLLLVYSSHTYCSRPLCIMRHSMKLIKIYLWTACGLVVVGIFAGMYVWYTVQKLDTAILEGDTEVFSSPDEVQKEIPKKQEDV
jgi:hypothetical protein